MNNPELGKVYQEIIALARTHNVSCEETELDVMAQAISQLADNNIVVNDATRAIANLRRVKVLNTQQAHRLLLDLLAEMRG